MIKDHDKQVAKLEHFHKQERAARSTKFLRTISDQGDEREPVRKSGRKLWTDSCDEDVDYSDSSDDDYYNSERIPVRTGRRERSIERNTSGSKGYVSPPEVVSIPIPQRSRSRERDREPLPVRRERSRSLSPLSRERVWKPFVVRRERSRSRSRSRERDRLPARRLPVLRERSRSLSPLSRERGWKPFVVRRGRSRSLSRERVRTPLVVRYESQSPPRERDRVPPRRLRKRSVERKPVSEPANEVEQKVQDTVKRKKDKPKPVGFLGTTKKKEDKTSNGFWSPPGQLLEVLAVKLGIEKP